MSETGKGAKRQGETVSVPFDRIAAFVRHFSHDVRNSLNAMDLQTAFAVEIASDPELVEELKKIRGMINQGARMLQGVSNNFWVSEPNLIEYSARILVEDLRDRMSRLLPEHNSQIEWTNDLQDEVIAVDLEMICSATSELVKNAFHFGQPGHRVALRASAVDGLFELQLREPRESVPSAPENWGREPLLSARRGGYGMSLFHARAILKAHGGDITITHDPAPALLMTRVTVPLASSSK
jgi:signal transduction histidine kinase